MDGRLAAAPEGPTIASGQPEADAPERDLRELVAELRSICGDEWTYTQEHQLRTYESDGLLQYRAIPAAAVVPGTAEEVQRIVQACAREEVPWVARGSGSGLSGGALPVKDGVLIVMSRMKRILEIDLEHLPQPRQCDDDAVLDRERPAAEARSAAARDPRHLVLVARADDVGDLLRRRGQDHRARAHVVLQQPVGLVGPELVWVVDDVLLADDLAQPPDEGVPRGARAGRRGRLRAELRVRGHGVISTPTASMVGTL